MIKNIYLIILKLLQTLFSLLVLLLQSNGMNSKDFATISLLSYFLFATSFLDFGAGTKLIQEHFSDIRQAKISIQQEDGITRIKLQKSFPTFISLALLHSLLGQGYIAIVQIYTNYELSLISCACFFLSSFLISLSSMVSKTYIANGLMSLLLRIQIIGVLFQAAFFSLIFMENFTFPLMVIGLSVPNIVLLMPSIVHVPRISWGNSLSNFVRNLALNSKRSISFQIQVLQLVQYSSALVVPLLIARNSSTFDFSSYAILSKIFSTLTGVLGTLNLSEWRKASIEKMGPPSRIELILRFLLGFLIATGCSIILKILWKYIGLQVSTPPNSRVLILWVIYTGAQLLNWKYYYFILSKNEYLKLINSSGIQLLISVTLLSISPWNMTLTGPAAVSVGLMAGFFILSSSKRSFKGLKIA